MIMKIQILKIIIIMILILRSSTLLLIKMQMKTIKNYHKVLKIKLIKIIMKRNFLKAEASDLMQAILVKILMPIMLMKITIV